MGTVGHGGKIKLSSTVHTETRNVAENGVTETEIIRTITDHFSDGTSSTRRETKTIREEEISADGTTIIRPETAPLQTLVSPAPKAFMSGSTNPMMNPNSHPQTPPPINIASAAPLGPSSPPPSRHDDNFGPFVQEALICHNKYRRKHNVPPLIVSLELCKVAQNWAQQLAVKGSMENSHYGYGENIYWSSAPGQSLQGDVPVEYWYREESHFDWNKLDFQKSTGSFTQLIWKNSKEFGIAKATGSKGTFVVSFYSPPGNVLGQFRENVNKALY